MKFQFLGCGDAFGSGGRFNTCMLLQSGGNSALLDCGASSLVALKTWGVDPLDIQAVFLTHYHGDHFGGLPFLLLDAQFRGRTAPLTLAGAPGLERRLGEAMEGLFPGSSGIEWKFPLETIEIEPGQPVVVGAFQVTAYLVDHACGTAPYALRIEVGGKTVTYSGDTAWTPELIEASRDVDLFVCECYRFDSAVKHHLDLATLRSHLPQLTAKRIILTHLSENMLAHLDEVDIETAQDGKIVEL